MMMYLIVGHRSPLRRVGALAWAASSSIMRLIGIWRNARRFARLAS
jgi:hypothetical protein